MGQRVGSVRPRTVRLWRGFLTRVAPRHTLADPGSTPVAAKKRTQAPARRTAGPPDEAEGATTADEPEGEPEDDGEPEGPADDELEDVPDDGGSDAPKSFPLARVADDRVATRDPMTVYMREVQRHPVLPAEEQRQLAIRYLEHGDVDAAARLVTSNLRLVVKIAYEYRRAYKNIMDLVQEGNIGLMQAVKRYDPYRGVKLSSYAAWWIRAYMLRFILNNWRMVKIGTTQAQRKLFFNLNKQKEKLRLMGIEPTHAEIARRLDVDEKEVVEMDKRLSRGDASLDVPVGDTDGRQTTRMDLLPSSERSPDTVAAGNELDELVRTHLDEFRKTLAGKEAVIFDLRVTADDPLTLQQLGDRFGVSRERVRQLEARLHGKLRTYLRERIGDGVEIE